MSDIRKYDTMICEKRKKIDISVKSQKGQYEAFTSPLPPSSQVKVAPITEGTVEVIGREGKGRKEREEGEGRRERGREGGWSGQRATC